MLKDPLSSNLRVNWSARLRALADSYASEIDDQSYTPRTLREAADAIERLTRELEHARAEARAMHSAYASSVASHVVDDSLPKGPQRDTVETDDAKS